MRRLKNNEIKSYLVREILQYFKPNSTRVLLLLLSLLQLFLILTHLISSETKSLDLHFGVVRFLKKIMFYSKRLT